MYSKNNISTTDSRSVKNAVCQYTNKNTKKLNNPPTIWIIAKFWRLIFSQLIKKPPFCRTKRPISAFTTARRLYLSWARSIHIYIYIYPYISMHVCIYIYIYPNISIHIYPSFTLRKIHDDDLKYRLLKKDWVMSC